MDVTQALRDAENALRDFIASELQKKYGYDWEDHCGVTAERIDQWKERKKIEAKRQTAGVVDERLIYYADFYDLKPILKKHWSDVFSAALGDWKTIEVWLTQIERLRDPDAHRRELLPHQKHLAIGISGDIRTRLVRYRSKHEMSDDYFPRFESVRDNYGNIWTSQHFDTPQRISTILRPNDTLEFVITAVDPYGEDLEYGWAIVGMADLTWQSSNVISFRITKAYVSRHCFINLYIRSSRQYHAFPLGDFDHLLETQYTVLPPKE